ncbi:MAG: hypothetical protein E1N59_3386 [Puniceicoccaceae bacterium 5H]|nr:MAG: hypothetical protein E1N59_3386 [Puniceicoccaceae bacterium 5H]
MKTPARLASWLLQLIAAAILLQTLYFKFTAASESVYIFRTLGLEPVGRLGSGVTELIAAALLLSGRWSVYGAALALLVMLGALTAHLFTPLGIEVQGDGGLLFGLAITVAVCSLCVLWLRRQQWPPVMRR